MCFVRVFREVFILTAWRGSSEFGSDVRAAHDQGEFVGPASARDATSWRARQASVTLNHNLLLNDASI